MVFFFTSGKLGHGDTNRVYKPKIIEALLGLFIRKVGCGNQSSLALTSTGQVRRLRTPCFIQTNTLFIRYFRSTMKERQIGFNLCKGHLL